MIEANCATDWHPKNIKPYYADEYVFIIHGDCHEILPQLDVKVDLVHTDIPYNISQPDNGLRKLSYGDWDCLWG